MEVSARHWRYVSGNLGQWSRPSVDTGLEFTQNEAKLHTSGRVNEGSLAGSHRSGTWLEMEKAQKSPLWTSNQKGPGPWWFWGSSWEEVSNHLSTLGRVSAVPHSLQDSESWEGIQFARSYAPAWLGEVKAL